MILNDDQMIDTIAYHAYFHLDIHMRLSYEVREACQKGGELLLPPKDYLDELLLDGINRDDRLELNNGGWISLLGDDEGNLWLARYWNNELEVFDYDLTYTRNLFPEN